MRSTGRHLRAFAQVELSTAEVEARERSIGALADAVRALADATIRTRLANDELDAVREEVAALTRRLASDADEGPFGVRYNSEGRVWFWGNAASGLANPIAPPLVIEHPERGRAYAELELGPVYEGPPGLLHGGIAALLLDQMMSETATEFRRRLVTGTLTLKFRRATRLGRIRISCQTASEEGRKVTVVGELHDQDGVTIEASAVFLVLPED